MAKELKKEEKMEEFKEEVKMEEFIREEKISDEVSVEDARNAEEVIVPEITLDDRLARLQNEYTDLSEKIGKLNAFMGSPKIAALEEEDQTLLHHQLVHMISYRDVLKKRIERMADKLGK